MEIHPVRTEIDLKLAPSTLSDRFDLGPDRFESAIELARFGAASLGHAEPPRELLRIVERGSQLRQP